MLDNVVDVVQMALSKLVVFGQIIPVFLILFQNVYFLIVLRLCFAQFMVCICIKLLIFISGSYHTLTGVSQ
jgi:hypothetical protein